MSLFRATSKSYSNYTSNFTSPRDRNPIETGDRSIPHQDVEILRLDSQILPDEVSWVGCWTGQYDDVRCKCVCPSVTQTNGTGQSRKIFVKSFHEPSKCKCENVVDQWVQESQYHFCERCDCQWQRRNTTTIKVVVIFIICVISLLFLYMVFLLCLDPLMSRRPLAYTEQRNEEEQPEAERRREVEEVVLPATPGVMSRVKHKVCSVRGEQQKWKGTVQEQRKHIYDRHTMLN